MVASRMQITDSPAELTEAFSVFDKTGNGLIHASDFRKVMTNLGERFSDQEVNEMIREIGMDSKGRINTRSEFVIHPARFHVLANPWHCLSSLWLNYFKASTA